MVIPRILAILLMFLPVLGGLLVEIVSGSLLLALTMFGAYAFLAYEGGALVDRIAKRRVKALNLTLKSHQKEKSEIEEFGNGIRTRAGYLFLLTSGLFMVFWVSNNQLPDISPSNTATTNDWAFYGGLLILILAIIEGSLLGIMDANPSSKVPYDFDKWTRLGFRIGIRVGSLGTIGYIMYFYLEILSLYHIAGALHWSFLLATMLVSLLVAMVGGVVMLVAIQPLKPKVPPVAFVAAAIMLMSPIIVLLVNSLLLSLGVSLS